MCAHSLFGLHVYSTSRLNALPALSGDKTSDSKAIVSGTRNGGKSGIFCEAQVPVKSTLASSHGQEFLAQARATQLPECC